MNDSGRNLVRQNIRALMEFLQKYAPFNQMDEGDLAFLVERSALAFYSRDEVILSPDDGDVEHFYILKQGMIRGERQIGRSSKVEPTFEIYPGECFPMAALLGERATRSVHRALEDSFCLLLPKRHFVSLFARSSVFRDFCVRGVSSLLDQVNQQVQLSAVQNLGSQHSLDARLRDLVNRAPVSCSPDRRIRQVVQDMDAAGVGSILVVDADHQPLGIFTLRDLRRVAADPGADFEAPIATVMTHNPVTLNADASAFEAALAMARHHIAHIALVESGKLVAVVSERDLFALQRVDLVHLTRTIANAPKLATLTALRTEIRRLIDNMLAHGAAATQLNRIITLLNDHTLTRVIELVIEEEGDPKVPFTWLSFGSEGRREQTLLTDQDNGLLFYPESPGDTEDLRRLLLPLAHRINLALDACGFPLCKGNVMASNPELCRSAFEWEQWYQHFIQATTPANLLKASIYFDLRPVWGDAAPVKELMAPVLAETRRNTRFQRLLAANALSRKPPLTLFRNFVYSKEEALRHQVDLKVQGLTPFVDGARVLALSYGLAETNTLQRLHLLAQLGHLNSKDVHAWEEAYGVIQLLRMRQHQEQLRESRPLSNGLDPDQLNELDRRILKESFRQAQRLQQALELKYPQ